MKIFKTIMILSFLYYVGTGILLCVDPNWIFRMLNLPDINHIWAVQFCGIITFLFGFIFLFAFYSPFKFVKIVYLGLIAQILVPAFTFYLFTSGILPEQQAIPFMIVDILFAIVIFYAISSLKNVKINY